MKIKRDGGDCSWINFKYERLNTFCFVCGKIGHSERDCHVVYANPGKEIERVYGTWLRAPNRNTKVSTGSRWLRNAEGESKWEEYGESSKNSVTGNDKVDDKEKFKENRSSVAENMGDNGMITITAKNQEKKDIGGHFSNETTVHQEIIVGEKIITDPKRCRTEKEIILEENGPINMQTDGLSQPEENRMLLWSKNLNGAGSENQARRGLRVL